MATFTINIPADDLQDLVDAFSEEYSTILPDGSNNPLTQNQHAKLELAHDIKRKVRNYKRRKQALPPDPDIDVT